MGWVPIVAPRSFEPEVSIVGCVVPVVDPGPSDRGSVFFFGPNLVDETAGAPARGAQPA